MSTKIYTQEEAQRFKDQRDTFARMAIFAVNHFKTPGGGLVMQRDDKGGMEMEPWLTWFRRELKAVGIEWDDELLEYGRASNTNRKRMLKESPTLQGKLDAAKSARTPKEDQP
jgi:hypothetical protein